PKRKFSDKERDEESGLDYFGARYYSAPVRWPGGHAGGTYRWLSIDPALITIGALADSQAWNLYAFCKNNPITFYDPDGRVVICKDRAAFEALKRSLGNATLASKLIWDEKTGKVSIEDDVRSDSLNFISLEEVIKSDQVVEISMADKVSFLGKDGTEYNYPFVYSPGLGGFYGITLTPKNGRPSSTVHDGKGIHIYIANSTLKDYPAEQAKTLAEELYGHAYLYIIGAPFQHEQKGGFVNNYTKAIRERKY
ncbi:MAG: RHS repeat-associated core domain-containing protein, partial [Methanosarcinaceae archaeon]|nr:RHS repeat-associated core domain-containing protein [Methanosarcinaceae archaeon]